MGDGTGIEDNRESSGRDQIEMAWAPWKNGWNNLIKKSKERKSFRTNEER